MSFVFRVCVTSLNCLRAICALGKAIVIERQNKPIAYMKNRPHLAKVFLPQFPSPNVSLQRSDGLRPLPQLPSGSPRWPHLY